MAIEQLFIPTIGMRFSLAKDWTFKLYNERRNRSLIKKLQLVKPEDLRRYYRPDPKRAMEPLADVTFPKGLVLTIDRIYVRKGAQAYDSITFCVPKKSQTFSKEQQKDYAPFFGTRFWVKLGDANAIKCEVLDD